MGTALGLMTREEDDYLTEWRPEKFARRLNGRTFVGCSRPYPIASIDSSGYSLTESAR
jgi:hypothetical protein